MTLAPAAVPAPACPACGAPLDQAPPARGGILDGVPTAAEMESTALPHAARAAARRPEGGPGRCPACGEAVYRAGREAFRHRGAAPVLTMAAAADRLRNHLRRLAIVRAGRIDGDCYVLPYLRAEGRTPDGEASFALLAASLGEERLEIAFLPPADVRPFEPPGEGAAGRSGAEAAAVRVLPATLPPGRLSSRVEAQGWSIARFVELIHYPFWLMRVEDCGRLHGAWMDAIEGKLIHHRMRLARPIPRRGALAGWTMLPAAAAGAAALLAPGGGLAAAAAAWALGVPWIHAGVLRRWGG
jgi:ssDNA-binding Zn-finger/Zn-ribbon topoisomerase 1